MKIRSLGFFFDGKGIKIFIKFVSSKNISFFDIIMIVSYGCLHNNQMYGVYMYGENRMTSYEKLSVIMWVTYETEEGEVRIWQKTVLSASEQKKEK